MREGDLCVVIVGSDVGTLVSIPSGWSRLENPNSGASSGVYATYLWKYMGATVDSAVTVTDMGTATSAVSIAFRGSRGVRLMGTTATGTTGQPNPPSWTTTYNNSLALIVGILDDAATDLSPTQPTGYTQVHANASATGVNTAIAYKTVPTITTEDPPVWANATTYSDYWVASAIEVMPYSNVPFSVQTKQIRYVTANAADNYVLNITGGSSTLDASMATGQTTTCSFLLTNGTTPYYIAGVRIDGSVLQAVKWLGGSAPSAGNASSIDSYSFTIVKTGAGAFTLLGSTVRFA